MNVKYVIKIQPNISNQIQSGEMCAKKNNNKSNKKKRKKACYTMLCVLCVCLSVYNTRITGNASSLADS